MVKENLCRTVVDRFMGQGKRAGVTLDAAKWIDTDEAFEGGHCKSDHELSHVNSEAGTCQTCTHRTPPFEGLTVILSTAASHCRTFGIMHLDMLMCSRRSSEASAGAFAGGGSQKERCVKHRIVETEPPPHTRRCRHLGMRLLEPSQVMGIRFATQAQHNFREDAC